MPLQFGALKRRPFALYPPILNIEHNEWRVRNTTGPEILVSNLKSDVEFWIPKRQIRDISTADDAMFVVTLGQEMEYKAGFVRPYGRRVLEMPAAPGSVRPGSWEPSKPAGRKMAKEVAAVLVMGLLLVVVARFMLLRRAGPGVAELKAGDGYSTVVGKLGRPAGERTRPPYRALWYPNRSCYVVLRDGRYSGALDSGWHVIAHVDEPGHGDTEPDLRGLPRF